MRGPRSVSSVGERCRRSRREASWGSGLFGRRLCPGLPPHPVLRSPSERSGGLPTAFEAVGEALIAGRSATDACEVVGRLLGSQGVSLEETLADLRTTYELVLGTEPAFTDACAVALGWSEATLAYLHQLSCADPLTGLASMAHLRGRLTELYRGDARGPAPLRDRYALVVVEAAAPRLHRASPTRSSASTCGCPGSGSPPVRSSPAARPSAGSARAGSSSSPRGTSGWPPYDAAAQPRSRSVSAATAASGSGARGSRWPPTASACSTSSRDQPADAPAGRAAAVALA